MQTNEVTHGCEGQHPPIWSEIEMQLVTVCFEEVDDSAAEGGGKRQATSCAPGSQ